MSVRNTDTEAGRELWEAVDRAAERAPEWVKRRVENLVVCDCNALNAPRRKRCHRCGEPVP